MAVENKRWLDAETFNHGVALCQTIPGATAMQTAAYVGLKSRGVIGATASFIGFSLPAFLLMMTLAALYTRANNLPIVLSAFNGLQAIIIAIIANATFLFGRTALKNRGTAAIAGLAAALFGLGINPIFVIFIAALFGFLFIKPGQTSSNPPVDSVPTQTNIRPLLIILPTALIGFLLLYIFAPTLFDLAILLFRIDLFAFGGGFASIPLMLHEIVEVRHWMDGTTFMNGIVLGQVTPGPIVITATFIGYLLGGPLGGVIATVSIFLPSFTLVVALSPYFDRLQTSRYFNKVIGGILCSFVGLLLTTTIRFALGIQWDMPHILLASGVLTALLLKVDILWVVVIGTSASILMLT